jgi:hypothetical protein
LPDTHEKLSRRDRLPPRRLPLLYFGFAHLALAVAFATCALAPRSLLGFYYHPRLIFVVHLVTLGWITSSILGALHLVGPMALRTAMPARKIDYWTFGLYVLGVTGVIFHFLIDELSGVGLSGLVVILCVTQVGWKMLRPRSTLAAAAAATTQAVKLHFALAFVNFTVAALLACLLAFHKLWPFLPGHVLGHVAAHAHLAVLGWATMTVFASAYRLLPMFLPAAMPGGWTLYLTGVVYEVGVLGLFATLLAQSSWTFLFAVVTVLGILGFFGHVVWMIRHPRPAARGLLRPDLGVAQAMIAMGYLLASAVLGLYLAWMPSTEMTLRWIPVYGIFALVGFLSQMVVGIQARLLPIYSWLSAYADATAEKPSPPQKTPHELVDRRLQAMTFVLWTAGVPVLAMGFFLTLAPLTALGGWLLLAAVVCGAWGHAVLFRDAWSSVSR